MNPLVSEVRPSLPRRDFIGRMLMAVAGLSVLGWPRRAIAAPQGTEPYIGEIMIWAGNFAPSGWGLCNGQLLAIAQNTALYNVIGTTYGGNGVTTFALPDLRGRVPIHFGQGSGLTSRALGAKPGEEIHTLTASEMPSHTHTARASSAIATSATPAGMVPARNPAQIPDYGSTADVTLATASIANAGNGQPHTNTQPFLVLTYVIALQGLFPQP
jgi:microcystin-dependent protein